MTATRAARVAAVLFIVTAALFVIGVTTEPSHNESTQGTETPTSHNEATEGAETHDESTGHHR